MARVRARWEGLRLPVIVISSGGVPCPPRGHERFDDFTVGDLLHAASETACPRLPAVAWASLLGVWPVCAAGPPPESDPPTVLHGRRVALSGTASEREF